MADRRWPRRFDITDGISQTVYLTRWTLLTIRGWALRLHLFRRPDADECHHDHPWPFWTLVLWGGYVEDTPDGENVVRPGRLYYRPASYRHSILRLLRDRAVTLVLTGPKEREWGFYTALGFYPWRTFVSTPRKVRAFWCRTGADHD